MSHPASQVRRATSHPPPAPSRGIGTGWLSGLVELAPMASGQASSPETPTVGIARLAASAPLEQEGKEVDYYRLPVRSLLNRVDSPRVGFAWSINPYPRRAVRCPDLFPPHTPH